MKKLFLVRHGQTEMNERNLKQGSWDSPLTKKGQNQARQTGDYLRSRNIRFDHAYSSPAGRACDTLELITDMNYQRVRDLRELSFGSYEGQPSFLGAQIKPYGDYYVAFGGEGESAVGQRMEKALKEIMKQSDHQTVLVVSHGASMVNFIKTFYDLQARPNTFPIPNCAVVELEYDPKSDQFSWINMFDPGNPS